MKLRLYHALRGAHVHCRVFVNGAKSGELVFRKEEFDRLLQDGEQVGILAGVQVEFEEESAKIGALSSFQDVVDEGEHPLLTAKKAFVNDLSEAKEYCSVGGCIWPAGHPGTSHCNTFTGGEGDKGPRQDIIWTATEPTLAEKLSRFNTIEEMADYVGNEGSGALAAGSLEPLDYLEGFPDYERVLEARNLTADDMIREFTEFEDHSEADEVAQIPRSERLRAFREGFEALERLDIADLPPQVEPFLKIGHYAAWDPKKAIDEHGNYVFVAEKAQKPPKTDPNSLLQALFRWGEARAGEGSRLSPKLFALVTEAVFPSGETVLERFLASARVVKPYFRAEVSENGLKLTDLEGI